MVKSILCFMALTVGMIATAQEDNQIESTEFIVEKDKELILPKVQRLFEPIKFDLGQDNDEVQNFIVEDVPLKSYPYNPSIEPQSLEMKMIEKTFNNYLKMGFGRYNAPVFSYQFKTLNERGPNAGTNIDYETYQSGPVLDELSAQTKGSLSLWYFNPTNNGHFSSFFKYGFNQYYNFGTLEELLTSPTFDSSLDNFERQENQFDIGVNYDIIVPSKSQLSLSPSWHYTSQNKNLNSDDNTKVGLENDFNIDVKIDHFSQNIWTVDFDAFAAFSQFTNSQNINLNRFWIYGHPNATAQFGALSLSAGAKIGIYQDVERELSFLAIPDLEAIYKTSSDLAIYARLDGDIIRNDFRSITNLNPHLTDSLVLATSVIPIRLKIGSKGYLIPRFQYDISLSLKLLQNQVYFRNNRSDPSVFELIYDPENSYRLDYETAFNYQLNHQLALLTSINFVSIENQGRVEPWYVPKLSYDLGISIKLLNDVLQLKPSFILLDGILAPDFGDLNMLIDSARVNVITLPTVLDLGMDVDFKINSKPNAFLKMRNLLGRENQIYYLYNSRVYDIKGGLSVRF